MQLWLQHTKAAHLAHPAVHPTEGDKTKVQCHLRLCISSADGNIDCVKNM
jgi:hypothetical protein